MAQPCSIEVKVKIQNYSTCSSHRVAEKEKCKNILHVFKDFD